MVEDVIFYMSADLPKEASWTPLDLSESSSSQQFNTTPNT